MSDAAVAIMDAAERRIRLGGFNGFSFREIAADVGIKSSSVHYHFPTKEKLAAAVIHRYTDETSKFFDEKLAAEPDPVKVLTSAVCGTVHSAKRMCPAAVLGASALDLPPEVAAEVKRFFKMCLDKLLASGLSPENASQFLATITGAQVIANALRDTSIYDHATSDILQFSKTKRRRPKRGRS